MVDQIFISHSARDIEILRFFVQKFDDTSVKPQLMEYEKWSRMGKPNWMWIIEEIQKSKALFLILTKNIVEKEHTQNWVAFEIGVASASNPPIPIFVFKEQEINFPVPYLNYYFDQPLSNVDLVLKTSDFSETLLNVIFHIFKESLVEQMITDKKIEIEGEGSLKCSKCLLKFFYMGWEQKVKCPCCYSVIDND